MRTPVKLNRLWLAFPLLVYLLVPNRNYYWDGVSIALNVEAQLPLRQTLYPNHLLYIPANVWLYAALLALGLKTRALFLMQFVNSVLGGASVVLVYRGLHRRDFSSGTALAAALAFGFAATWWRFSTDANAYIPAIFLILCANDLLETGRRPAWAGLALASAMLSHQLAILFLPAALVRYKEPKKVLEYLATSIVRVALIYGLAYRTVHGNFTAAGLLRWITSYAPDARFSFDPFRDAFETLWGTLRLFFGGKPGVAKPYAFTIAGCIGLAFVLFELWRTRDESVEQPPQATNRTYLWIWLAVYVAFLFFWMPQNVFYRLFYLPPLAWLGARLLRGRGRLVCAAMFLWNAVFLIAPESRVENNVPLRFALDQHDRWPAGTPIVFQDYHPDLWTISYFNPQASWIWLGTMDLERLQTTLDAARQRGQPLWLEATGLQYLAAEPQGQAWLESHAVSRLLHFKDAKHEFRFYEVR